MPSGVLCHCAKDCDKATDCTWGHDCEEQRYRPCHRTAQQQCHADKLTTHAIFGIILLFDMGLFVKFVATKDKTLKLTFAEAAL